MIFDKDFVKAAGGEYEERLISYRRHIHQNAELSFKEFNTSKFIRDNLAGLPLTFKEGISGNSMVAVLDTGKPGPSIGIRADMDALPINEVNGWEFASKNEGVMHACGHDAHTAILIGLAQAMCEKKDHLAGKLTFIFQQGEELLPGGAKPIIEEGGLEGLDCVYALHVRTNLDIGQFDAEYGVRSCAAQAYEIEIKGKGGHTGFPHLARDPIATAAAAIEQIVTIVPQCVNPRDTATIAVGYIHSSNEKAANVYSDTVRFGGTIRTLNNDLVETLPEMIKERAEAVSKAHGCECTYTRFPGYAAVNNSTEHYKYVDEAGTALGYENVPTDDIMGAEDFSYMLMEKPGAYFTIGARDPEDEKTSGARHSPDLFLSEKVLREGFEIMMGTVLITMDKWAESR
jgi:amidohydrolase